jgi:hypothetical protein
MFVFSPPLDISYPLITFAAVVTVLAVYIFMTCVILKIERPDFVLEYYFITFPNAIIAAIGPKRSVGIPSQNLNVEEKLLSPRQTTTMRLLGRIPDLLDPVQHEPSLPRY